MFLAVWVSSIGEAQPLLSFCQNFLKQLSWNRHGPKSLPKKPLESSLSLMEKLDSEEQRIVRDLLGDNRSLLSSLFQHGAKNDLQRLRALILLEREKLQEIVRAHPFLKHDFGRVGHPFVPLNLYFETIRTPKRRRPIAWTPSLDLALTQLSEGNLAAKEILKRIQKLKGDDAHSMFRRLEELNIRGGQIRAAFDLSGENVENLVEFLRRGSSEFLSAINFKMGTDYPHQTRIGTQAEFP
jgi:hypothetical protein